jgi:putative Mg2+ transporter-C (MgtC) family protein
VTEGKAFGITGGDPSRIIAGVATGIGFLGAGSIIQSRGQVRGITTAAGIWVVGGIGACCGAGRYSIAFVTVVLSLIILAILPKVESQPHPGREKGGHRSGYPDE